MTVPRERTPPGPECHISKRAGKGLWAKLRQEYLALASYRLRLQKPLGPEPRSEDPGPDDILAHPAPVAIGIFARLPQRLHGGHGAPPQGSQSPADHASGAVTTLYGHYCERSGVVAPLLRWSLLPVHNQVMLASDWFDTHS